VKSTLLLFSMAMLAGDQQGWSPREGVLLKYRVNLRFGEELVNPLPALNQKADLRFDGDDDTMPRSDASPQWPSTHSEKCSSFTVATALIR
jgi:hypothetical protein